MKLISWNVNGLRACYKKGCWEWFLNESPDIFCLQETKAHPEQLPEEVRNPHGYYAYFDHSKLKKGYSGVAVFTKIEPEKVEYGMGIEEFDQEGRLLSLFFKNFVLINIYFPNGGGGPARLDYKLRFYDAFLNYIEKLRKSAYKIIFCGDINTAHKEIDLARPIENENNSGFLPIERMWIDKVINKGYFDSFRYFYPNAKNKYTYWDMKTFARNRNIGWRLDYFFVNDNLKQNMKKAGVLDNILGSDHCPILLELK